MILLFSETSISIKTRYLFIVQLRKSRLFGISVGRGSIAMLSMALQEGFGASSKLIFVVGDGGPTKFICQEE